MRKPYSISKPPKGRKTYRYKLPGMSSYRSTGKTTRAAAEKYVIGLAKGEFHDNTENMTLKAFAAKMFVPGECNYLKRKLSRDKPISPEMARMRRGHLENHIFPNFGDRLLVSITQNELDRWLIELQLSNKTKNHVLDTLRIIWREAKNEGLLKHDIAEGIERFNPKQVDRDALRPGEIRQLFSGKFEDDCSTWGSPKLATLFTLLITTGIRLGEAYALTWDDIRHTQDDKPFLVVNKAAKNDRRIGSTKNGKERVTPLLPIADEYLKNWRQQSNFSKSTDLIFSNDRGGVLQRNVAADCFLATITKSGIHSRDRVLVPHSLRHTFNTFMRPILGDEVLQEITGHSSKGMTDHYDHPSVDSKASSLMSQQTKMSYTWNELFEDEKANTLQIQERVS